jgi:BirA family biotin operon repressor/biotin-[acetyl-CoA-carboxylase] ligase
MVLPNMINPHLSWAHDKFHNALTTNTFTLQVVDELSSSNDYLLTQIKNNALTQPTCVVALHQTRGRGRQGKTWLSDPQHSLTFSVNYCFNLTINNTTALPLVVALAVTEALELLSISHIRIKWPNDILRRQDKLAGILVETGQFNHSSCHLVIGIGINISQQSGLYASLDASFADCSDESGYTPSREQLLALILNRLDDYFVQFEQEGFTPFINKWLHHCDHFNQSINLLKPDGRVASGTHTGVLHDGSIVITNETGEEYFHTGEISLRRA